MVRVADTQNLIYEGLRALDWRRYFCAMWIVCGELQALYEDRVSEAERSLLTETLDVVRDAVRWGERTAGITRKAADLQERWRKRTLERQDEVMPGHWNTWMVFQDLAGELAGTAPQYEATGRVDLAATDRWRESQPGPLFDDPDEEVNESSPMARTLSRLERAVAEVAKTPESGMREAGWDPVKVRALFLR